jgi:hypothetical protein
MVPGSSRARRPTPTRATTRTWAPPKLPKHISFSALTPNIPGANKELSLASTRKGNNGENGVDQRTTSKIEIGPCQSCDQPQKPYLQK